MLLHHFFIDLGRFVSNSWAVTPLNDLHNLYNPAEVQRLKDEHPGEDDLIAYDRTKGQLGVTRGKRILGAMQCFFLFELT